MELRLTEKGKAEVERFRKECFAKKKELLDAGKDTCEEEYIPTEDDVLSDIPEYTQKDGLYWNGWGVTDNYSSDYPLALQRGEDFVDLDEIREKLHDTYKLDWMLSHGYTLTDVYEKFMEISNNYDYDPEVKESNKCLDTIMDDIIDEFEETGFLDGSMWVCYKEFLDAEAKDFDYVQHLFEIGRFTEEEKKVYITEYFSKPKERVIFSNYDIDEYREGAIESLKENGNENPTERQIDDECIFISETYWHDEVERLKETFDDSKTRFLAVGTCGRWNGTFPGGFVFSALDELQSKLLKDCGYFKFWDENGELFAQGSHHDGTNSVQIRRLTPNGDEMLSDWEYDYNDNRSEQQIHKELFENPELSEPVGFAHRYYGCPEVEWEIPMAAA